METWDDAALMAQVADGDRGPSLEELYRRFERRLFGLGLRLLGDRGLAEELVQETFVRLWRTAARFDPAKGAPSAYLFAIARRIAVDLWRRPSSRTFEPEPGEAAPGEDPVDAVLIGLTVRDALESLSTEHREVLELAHFSGLTQAEIAEKLGLPLGTVKTRTFFALKALRVTCVQRGLRG